MIKKTKYIKIKNELIKKIGEIADKNDTVAFVVGGYVRDKLLGKEIKDIDIMVIGDGITLANQVAKVFGIHKVITYEKFGTAMLPIDDGKVEFVSAREELYEQGSRKPFVIKSSLEEDLSRRDFTINALAVSINEKQYGKIEDPFNGEVDLKNRIIRTPLDPEKTFNDDPLRIMRAIRFACELQFEIQEDTLRAIEKMKDRLSIVSQERITDEFFKILASPKPSTGLLLLHETGVAKIIFPELSDMAGVDQRDDYHHKDVLLHTLKVVDSIAEWTEDVWLRFVGLVHDIAKPRTKDFKPGIGWTFHGHEEIGARMMKGIFRRMRLPMGKLPYITALVRLHLRPMVLVSEEITDSAVRRVLFEAGDLIDDLMILCRADITSQNPNKVSKYLKNYDNVIEKMKEVEEKDRMRNWQPPVRGDEIMRICGLESGKTVGILKKEIENAILNGSIPNEHDAAIEYLYKIKDKILSEIQSHD
ncbi:MAG: CCA tRNA nucleotidyltransferase [Bacteroidetes bacterium]|nr:CCA tRNA nucleotidyltransferase [Bacteroidota bacterium]MBU1421887.1 CCA tRNA nucleotidyltransferase [Bacteroidota bacterium]MBU2635915.1 CCA tRNA nucleotidyltransferase [Bacteroidota bacterium]